MAKEGFSQPFQFEGSVSRRVVFYLPDFVVFCRPFAGRIFPIRVVASSLGKDFDCILLFYLNILLRVLFSSCQIYFCIHVVLVIVCLVDECLLPLYFFKTCGNILVHPALLNFTLS